MNVNEMAPRFFFYGNAAAMSGRIYRPRPFDVEVECASSLTPAGGISRAHVAPGAEKHRPGNAFLSFGSAATLAEGRYDDEAKVSAPTRHKVGAEALRATTTVSAEVNGFAVDIKPRLEVRLLRGVLTSTSPDFTCEPAIQLGDRTAVEGVTLGGVGLRVSLDFELFQTFDTRSKLVAACQSGEFLAGHRTSLLLSQRSDPSTSLAARTAGSRAGSPAAAFRRLTCKDLLYASIVKEITWTRRRHPDATIDGHTVVVKNFGRIFFGEILIGAMTRRLTMMRLELGSPVGGDIGCAAVGKNGSWVP